MSRRTRPPWVVVVTFGLLAAACGSDRAPTQVAVSTSTSAPASVPDTADDTPPADDDTDSTVPDTAPPPAVPMFGDLEMPCNGGDTSAYPDSDRGVTADTIKIGTGDDRGFASSPGLNEEMGDAVVAIAEWCNELGGINGREIDLTLYDAKILEVNNVMLESCQSDFMLVGQGFALDGTGEQTRVECGLSSVPAFSVSTQFAHGPGMIQPVPNPGDQHGIGQIAYVVENFPEAARHTAVMYGNFEATTVTKDKVLSAAADLGLDLGDQVIELEYNIQGEDSWAGFVLEMQSEGVEHLYFTGSCSPNLLGLMETAQANGFAPILTLESNFYVDVCAGGNTSGALDGALVRIVFFPFEEADAFPAVQQYVDLMDGAGKKKSQLGMQSVSAFLLWATGAKACGEDLTRQCVLDRVAEIEEWTGGGLHVPSYPAGNESPGCELLMRVAGTGYERVFPEEPGSFECDDNTGQVTGPVVDAADLDENRISTTYTG